MMFDGRSPAERADSVTLDPVRQGSQVGQVADAGALVRDALVPATLVPQSLNGRARSIDHGTHPVALGSVDHVVPFSGAFSDGPLAVGPPGGA